MTKDAVNLDAYTVSFMPFYTEYQGPTEEFKDYKFEDTIYFRGKELKRKSLRRLPVAITQLVIPSVMVPSSRETQ